MYKTILGSPMIDFTEKFNKTNISQEQLDLELFKAISNKEFYRTKKIIDQGANINAQANDSHDHKKPIHLAAELNHEGIVELLLNKGVNVNDSDKHGWTALHYAANSGSLEVVKFLIEKGADINRENAYGKKPIHRAAENNYKNIIEFFLSKGVDINSSGGGTDTPLRCAAWKGHIDTVMYLLYNGATINVGDIEFLLSKGVNINAVDDDGRTLLHWTCIEGNLEAAKFLIAKNANVNAKDKYGMNPIHFVVVRSLKQSRKSIIELLLANGADIDALDNYGWTPLHMAISFENLENAKFLIEKEANVNAEDVSGKKPIDLSIEFVRNDIIEYLEKVGKKVVKREVNSRLSSSASIAFSDFNSKNNSVKVNITQSENELGKKAEGMVEALNKTYGSILNNVSSSKIAGISRSIVNNATKSLSNITKNLFSKTNPVHNRVIRSIEDPSQILQHNTVVNATPNVNTEIPNNISTVIIGQASVNHTILLADLIMRKLTGKKYSHATEQSIPEIRARSIAYSIVENFRETLNYVDEAKLEKAVDFIGLQADVYKAVMRGDGIKKTMESYLKDAFSKLGTEIDEHTAAPSTVVKDIALEQASNLNIQ